jgi:catechol 2,3-dioxygenase
MTQESSRALYAQTPLGLNHLVLNVRDIDAAHTFWTECLGFKQVGSFRRPGSDGSERTSMRFYSGQRDGKLTHHDIAFIEVPELARQTAGGRHVFNHVAITYADRESWEAQIAFLAARGVTLSRRVERGATNSIHLEDPDGNEIELVFELPRERWEHDIDAALNHAVARPISG